MDTTAHRRAWSAALLTMAMTATAVVLAPPTRAAGPLIAVLDNPTYVDTSQASPYSPSDNVQAALTAKGYTVRTFTEISNAGFQKGLAGAKLLAIPRLIADLPAAMTPQARRTLREYVASGGGLLLFPSPYDPEGGLPQYDMMLLDQIFFDMTISVTINSGFTEMYGTASGTRFDGGPVTLPNAPGETRNVIEHLPPEAAPIYVDEIIYGSSVVLFGFGSGEIVRFSWTWSNASSSGGTFPSGAWNKVLDRAAQEVMGPGCNITGTPGADFINGTVRSDRICSREGSDYVQAGRGNDIVVAGEGDDIIVGGDGNDILLLETGDDRGDGQAGNDTINGGPGNDNCTQGGGTGKLISC